MSLVLFVGEEEQLLGGSQEYLPKAHIGHFSSNQGGQQSLPGPQLSCLTLRLQPLVQGFWGRASWALLWLWPAGEGCCLIGKSCTFVWHRTDVSAFFVLPVCDGSLTAGFKNMLRSCENALTCSGGYYHFVILVIG